MTWHKVDRKKLEDVLGVLIFFIIIDNLNLEVPLWPFLGILVFYGVGPFPLTTLM